jgi:hypothetical protein
MFKDLRVNLNFGRRLTRKEIQNIEEQRLIDSRRVYAELREVDAQRGDYELRLSLARI